MDALEAIFTRRSIRKFTGQPVSEYDIKLVLKAGMSAPSAHNIQPWQFIVVCNQEKLEYIATSHPYAKMLPQAGCGIIVCGDLSKQKLNGFIQQDCAAAIENMLIAAHSINLGSVWCGLYPVATLTKAVAKILELPKDIMPIGMVVIGHSDTELKERNNYDESKIHYEKW